MNGLHRKPISITHFFALSSFMQNVLLLFWSSVLYGTLKREKKLLISHDIFDRVWNLKFLFFLFLFKGGANMFGMHVRSSSTHYARSVPNDNDIFTGLSLPSMQMAMEQKKRSLNREDILICEGSFFFFYYYYICKEKNKRVYFCSGFWR